MPQVILTDSTPSTCVSTLECPAVLSRSASVLSIGRKSTDSKTLEISPLQTPTESGSSSPSVGINDQDNTDSSMSTNGEDDSSNKRKRFCNTYNILSKSGLLDITLRTKELIRQNRRTQGDLDRLREHTNLFMEVLKSGDSTVVNQLLTSMQEEVDREKNT